jgi:urease accessory protein
MDRDSKLMRKGRPYLFTNVRAGDGVAAVEDFIVKRGGLTPA